MENLCIGIDIRAGLGVKMKLFTDPHHQIEYELLCRNEYADDLEGFVAALSPPIRSTGSGTSRCGNRTPTATSDREFVNRILKLDRDGY